MAAVRHDSDEEDVRECSNCGETGDLLKCSRCQIAWFCSLKCQKAYWPLHKANCYCNEFADLTAASEPKFARWMRKHQKLAVLKDDEVDRLERASAACTGPSRHEVMDSMYNRLDPRPKGPSYSAEERRAMHEAEESAQTQAKLIDQQAGKWSEIAVPLELGLDCGRYKWWQNQTFLEVFFLIPEKVSAKQVTVRMSPSEVLVVLGERTVLKGSWYGEIKQEESTWYIQDGILNMQLLKRNRRGSYANGSNNADTFWKSLVKKCAVPEILQLEYPPTSYYLSHVELDQSATPKRLTRGSSSAHAAREC